MIPFLRLAKHGQSYWLDTLSRELIESGELKRRVDQEALSGVTSNPTTLHAALTSANDSYRPLIDRTSCESAKELYEKLVTTDATQACDILRSRYNGRDGFVSLEVSPHLAHDPAGTVVEAQRLRRMVERDNLMIQVPATTAGLSAIEQLILDGIHVNATLLFSVRRYALFTEAYLRALERRLMAGQRLDNVNSVASFFVSRIDTIVDPLLSSRPEDRARRLRGRVGVASAKLAFEFFRRFLEGERWSQLAGAGANEPRLLWASTSTRNPEYPELMYVEPLIGPQTINAMNLETIEAFKSKGSGIVATIADRVNEAHEVMSALEELGVDMERTAQKLESDGLQQSIAHYDATLRHLASDVRPGAQQVRDRQEPTTGSVQF